jgi:hypothetical protein
MQREKLESLTQGLLLHFDAFIKDPKNSSHLEKIVDTILKAQINPRPIEMDYSTHYFYSYLQDAIRLTYGRKTKLGIFKSISEDMDDLETIFPSPKRTPEIKEFIKNYDAAFEILKDQTEDEKIIPSTEQGFGAISEYIDKLRSKITNGDLQDNGEFLQSVFVVMKQNSKENDTILSKNSVDEALEKAAMSIGYRNVENLTKGSLTPIQIVKAAHTFFVYLRDRYTIFETKLGERDFLFNGHIYSLFISVVNVSSNAMLNMDKGRRIESESMKGYESIRRMVLSGVSKIENKERETWRLNLDDNEGEKPIKETEQEYTSQNLTLLNTGKTFQELDEYVKSTYSDFGIGEIIEEIENSLVELDSYEYGVSFEKINFSSWKIITAIMKSYTRRGVSTSDPRTKTVKEVIDFFNSIKKTSSNYEKSFDDIFSIGFPFPHSFEEIINKMFDMHYFFSKIEEKLSLLNDKVIDKKLETISVELLEETSILKELFIVYDRLTDQEKEKKSGEQRIEYEKKKEGAIEGERQRNH